ncbi:hypothetical protein GEMRC1_002107 [Eukaryota sp. GEM-RC1]
MSSEKQYKREVCGDISRTEKTEHEVVCRPRSEVSETQQHKEHYKKTKACFPVKLGSECEEHATGEATEEERVIIEPIYRNVVQKQPFVRVTHKTEAISRDEAERNREVISYDSHSVECDLPPCRTSSSSHSHEKKSSWSSEKK